MDSSSIYLNRSDRSRRAVSVMDYGPARLDPRANLHHPHGSDDSHFCNPSCILLQTSQSRAQTHQEQGFHGSCKALIR